MLTTWSQRGALVLLVLLALWGFWYRLGEVPLLDDPNESEYAEVAREMVETGDWTSPQLNYVLFLNKPPLSYWLIASAYHAFGVSEFAARFPSALSALLIVLLVGWLGAVSYDVETGLLAGFLLFATGGFFIEAHQVRPDLMLTLGIVGSLVAIAHLFRSPPRSAVSGGTLREPQGERNRSPCEMGSATARAEALDARAQTRWPLIALQVSLAVGLLAKGMLAVIVPGVVFVVMVAGERRSDLVRQMLRPRAWWLFVLLVAPWHVAMSLTHPGFLWDYAINQHVLFFFDRKFPRDSVPVSLPVFWAAFAARLVPWTIVAPLAVVTAAGRARRGAGARADRLILAWAAAVLLFFSAASSRMEHYCIPALPALALLLAKLFREYARDRAGGWPRLMTAHVVLLAIVSAAGLIVAPRVVGTSEWLAAVPEFVGLARTVFGLLAAGTFAAAGAGLLRRRSWVAPAIAATVAAVIPSFHHGLTLVARINSSAGVAATLRRVVAADARLVYQAPIEYQNCAGFNFYLRRKLDLLQPPDFVAPPYLEPYVDDMFISREQLEALWRTEHVFLITDPLASRPNFDGVIPQPFTLVARDNVRWAVTNRPAR